MSEIAAFFSFNKTKHIGTNIAAKYRQFSFFNQGVSYEAFYAKGFYPDRVDDRGRDYRYFGCGGFARLPGLHCAREDV